MNSADRSIAIVDVAVRRRFAFVSVWPQMKVVEQHGCKLMQEAFQRIVSIFIENATRMPSRSCRAIHTSSKQMTASRKSVLK